MINLIQTQFWCFEQLERHARADGPIVVLG
jgi:hypothetical protein